MKEELKPEDDKAVPPRWCWYVVSRGGLATLCSTKDDAIIMARHYTTDYPRGAPYAVLQLGDVAAERERCAGVCEDIARQYRADGHGHSAERAANAIRLAAPAEIRGA